MLPPNVLIIDDDPEHLRIYAWIVQAAGYQAHTALVKMDRVDLPDGSFHLVLLDYHLNVQMKAPEVAQLVRSKLSDSIILVLSDVLELPDDIAPFVNGFIRKGDPSKLVATLAKHLGPTK